MFFSEYLHKRLTVAFLLLSGGSDIRYQRISTRLTWPEADGDCRSRKGRLLVLDSPEKVTKFREQIEIETGEMLWTAGYREHSPWVWVEGKQTKTCSLLLS